MTIRSRPFGGYDDALLLADVVTAAVDDDVVLRALPHDQEQ